MLISKDGKFGNNVTKLSRADKIVLIELNDTLSVAWVRREGVETSHSSLLIGLETPKIIFEFKEYSGWT